MWVNNANPELSLPQCPEGNRKANTRGSGPASSRPWINAAGQGPFPHYGGIRGCPHSHNAPGSQRCWAPGQPLPGKFSLGTSGGYYRPYGLWNLTTGGRAGPDGVITCGVGPMDEMEWIHRHPKAEDLRVGLISWAGTYLTFEACKNTVTATAKSLGRRQTWEILVSNEHETQAVVRLKSVQGLYLLCECDGTMCYGRPRTSHHGCFLLRFHRNSKWTLQCLISGRYLESNGKDVFCTSRVLSAYHMWTPRPALHVHVILYSPVHRCYARADPTMGRIWVDAAVPCREECGFLLHFRDGCYHLETSTHHFLSHVDRLFSQPSSQTAFHMQVRPGGLVALCDGEGGMLYPQGTHLLLGLGCNPVRGEEWFILQHCPTWVSLRSKTERFISVIYDDEVRAASERLTPMSLFQFECDSESPTVQLRSANGYYLAQRRHRAVMADGHPLESDTFFRMHWNCGRIILQSCRGRFLGITPNGLLMANATLPGPNEEFGILFANRPFLVLRGRYGYVGSSSGHDLIQCNQDQPDCIHLLPCRQGIYHFQGEWLLFPA
ncbi:hypothetical protein H8959_007845 [Pygathrix nigripes]